MYTVYIYIYISVFLLLLEICNWKKVNHGGCHCEQNKRVSIATSQYVSNQSF